MFAVARRMSVEGSASMSRVAVAGKMDSVLDRLAHSRKRENDEKRCDDTTGPAHDATIAATLKCRCLHRR